MRVLTGALAAGGDEAKRAFDPTMSEIAIAAIEEGEVGGGDWSRTSDLALMRRPL